MGRGMCWGGGGGKNRSQNPGRVNSFVVLWFPRSQKRDLGHPSFVHDQAVRDLSLFTARTAAAGAGGGRVRRGPLSGPECSARTSRRDVRTRALPARIRTG